MTIQHWLRQATTQLQNAGIPSARLDAELLLAHVVGKDRSWVAGHGDDELSKDNHREVDALLAKRIKHVPVAYLTGTKEFYGRDFTVTPDTLIPRPETEAIIDIVKSLRPGRVLDVGCGSGCIGISIKAELPDTSVTLSDISPHALDVARSNSKLLSIHPLRFVESDLLSHWLSHTDPKPFDMIIANLPYVSTAWEVSPETTYEPQSALYAEDDGLELIKELIDDAATQLTKDGYLLLEADPRQFPAISSYALPRKLKTVTTQSFALLLQRF